MTPPQEQTLWIGAFRYYLGRRTYAVSDFCQLLIQAWPALSGGTKWLITKEVNEAFELEDQGHSALGMDCDRAEWERVRKLFKDKS